MKRPTKLIRRYRPPGPNQENRWETDIGDHSNTEMALILGISPGCLDGRWFRFGDQPEKLFAPHRSKRWKENRRGKMLAIIDAMNEIPGDEYWHEAIRLATKSLKNEIRKKRKHENAETHIAAP